MMTCVQSSSGHPLTHLNWFMGLIPLLLSLRKASNFDVTFFISTWISTVKFDRCCFFPPSTDPHQLDGPILCVPFDHTIKARLAVPRMATRIGFDLYVSF